MDAGVIRLSTCVFCQIIDGKMPAEFVRRNDQVVAIVPLSPIVPGHVIVMPTTHVGNFTESWPATMDAMYGAYQIASARGGDCNLITSKGEAATQTIGHLHIHIVPRRPGDGLKLPWAP